MDCVGDAEAAERIVNFLKAHVPRDDIANIPIELKKDFVFGKKKARNKKQKRKKHQYITRKEKKELGFYNIPRKSVKYADFLEMNTMWERYMDDLLELSVKSPPNITDKAWEPFTQSVYKADFHGSYLKVVRSKCNSYVNKEGICIMDTKNTFKIVSKTNIITTIPKKECVFDMLLGSYTITILGKHFCTRSAERSVKKIKSLTFPDL